MAYHHTFRILFGSFFSLEIRNDDCTGGIPCLKLSMCEAGDSSYRIAGIAYGKKDNLWLLIQYKNTGVFSIVNVHQRAGLVSTIMPEVSEIKFIDKLKRNNDLCRTCRIQNDGRHTVRRQGRDGKSFRICQKRTVYVMK